MALQWLNEVPVPALTPHFDPAQPDKRFHEKMWIIDGETDDAIAVTGGLNIDNAYFRTHPQDPDDYWSDQDVVDCAARSSGTWSQRSIGISTTSSA